MEKVLEHLVGAAPIIKDILPGDYIIAVNDVEKCLIYFPAKAFDFGLKPGDPVLDKHIAYKAVQQKTKLVAEVSTGDSVFGVPYRAIAYPVSNESGVMVGSMVLCENTERTSMLKEISAQIDSIMTETVSGVRAVADEAGELAMVGSQLSATSDTVMQSVARTDEALDLIKHIADQTKLLGLNATIEAARLGAQGRAFNVVATEVRKLAVDSYDSAGDINNVFRSLQLQVKELQEAAQKIGGVSSGQAAAIQQILAGMETLKKLTGDMKDLATG
jgi:hypothetical protein